MDIVPYIKDNERMHRMRILERMTEPDRIVSFRVTWEDVVDAINGLGGNDIIWAGGVGDIPPQRSVISPSTS